MELPENRLWTVEEAAYFLNVPVKTLYQWKWLGDGPPVRKMGRHLRYNPAKLRAWAEPEAQAA
ncbi:helix-turn-helix domain-containing protein [Nocardia speluncae]|uniref:Helix-turn-helix domain-containing protein n=1 Tax=Nocardia speluncae TaxID=419477 RepID=A0A846XC68_9NOCA|nr:helix-turn-helix domain-containing protein [Nocardia speluncae]NKY33931.1 helix-turn-helix domain-containing protein [Nocardia speluncae]